MLKLSLKNCFVSNILSILFFICNLKFYEYIEYKYFFLLFREIYREKIIEKSVLLV